MRQGFIHIGLIIGIVILIGVAAYFVVNQQFSPAINPIPTPSPIPEPSPTPVPKPVPVPEPAGNEVSLRVGEREGSLLVEKIYSDHITGLNFAEYPLPNPQGYPIELRIGERASNGCTVILTLVRIEGDTAIFTKEVKDERFTPCPICLAENTLIDTPSGAIAVQDMRVGDYVWTTDASGKRVSAKIQKTSRTPVPAGHRVIHLVLDDGRELFVSPGHPLGDGRVVANLSIGNTFDGARVIKAESILYGKKYTYDIFPAGGTGFYWANDILLGSTLFQSN